MQLQVGRVLASIDQGTLLQAAGLAELGSLWWVKLRPFPLTSLILVPRLKEKFLRQ